MRFFPIVPLRPWARVVRSVLIVALLLGSLFPQPFPVVLVAAAASVPVIIYEILRWAPRIHAILIVLIFFGVLAIPALSNGTLTAYGDEKLTRWVTLTLVSALAACLIRDKRSIQTLGAVWLVAAVGLAALALVGYDGGRAGDTETSNPIWLSRALATGVIFAVWMWWTRTARSIVMIAVIAVLALGLVAAGSRGPVLGIVVGVCVLTIVGGKGRWWRTLLIIAAGAIAMWAVQILPIFESSRFADLASTAASDQQRSNYQSLTLSVIEQHPEGVGFGNWAMAVGQPRHDWPHNLFLEVFAELGVVLGIVVVTAVIVVALRLALKAPREPAFLVLLALLSVELVAVSLSGDLNARTFWFLLALGFVATTPFLLDTSLAIRARSRRDEPVQAQKRL